MSRNPFFTSTFLYVRMTSSFPSFRASVALWHCLGTFVIGSAFSERGTFERTRRRDACLTDDGAIWAAHSPSVTFNMRGDVHCHLRPKLSIGALRRQRGRILRYVASGIRYNKHPHQNKVHSCTRLRQKKTKMLLKPAKIVLLSRPKLVLSHPYTIAIVVADVTVVDYEK